MRSAPPTPGVMSNNRQRRAWNRLHAMYRSLSLVQRTAGTAIAMGDFDTAEQEIEMGEETLRNLSSMLNGLAAGVEKFDDWVKGTRTSSSADGGKHAAVEGEQSESAGDEDEEEDDDEAITIVVDKRELNGKTMVRWTWPPKKILYPDSGKM